MIYTDKIPESITQEYVNHITGEVVAITYNKDNPKPKNRRYWIVYPKFFDVTSNIDSVAYKVLHLIIKKMNKRNLLTIKEKSLMRLAGISRATLYRALKQLKEVNIIYKDGSVIYINPDLISKAGKYTKQIQSEYFLLFNKITNEGEQND